MQKKVPVEKGTTRSAHLTTHKERGRELGALRLLRGKDNEEREEGRGKAFFVRKKGAGLEPETQVQKYAKCRENSARTKETGPKPTRRKENEGLNRKTGVPGRVFRIQTRALTIRTK